MNKPAFEKGSYIKVNGQETPYFNTYYVDDIIYDSIKEQYCYYVYVTFCQNNKHIFTDEDVKKLNIVGLRYEEC